MAEILLTSVLSAVGTALGGWWLAYANQKGKNLADKEDIKRLTELVEGVKHANAELLERMKLKNQLRLAAVDRRLQAHQEAYSHWRSCSEFVFSEEIHRLAADAFIWWNDNCLYLSADAREAFVKAIRAAREHHELKRNLEGSAINAMLLQSNMDIVRAAGPLIVAGASLPSLGDDEFPEPTSGLSV